MNLNRKIFCLSHFVRYNSTIPVEFVNRNPRNLERLRIARKPSGYHLDKPGHEFWHRLELTVSDRAVTAQVVHFMNGPVIVAKTSEWAIRKQLYSIKDTCAFINLGRVLAQRCLESGISEMYCNIEKKGKVEKFLDEVVKGGIRLEEPARYKKPEPWDLYRPEKPWEVFDE